MFLLIDRYVATRFILFFLAGLIVFVTLFVTVDSMTTLARYDVKGIVLLKYCAFQLPAVIYQMLPIACLMATMFTIAGLNKSNELIALFSCGMSLARISAPILVIVGLLSGLAFFAGDRILPVFAKKEKYIYYMDIKKQPGLYSTVKTDRIWYRSRNALFNIKTMAEGSQKAQGLTMYYFDENWNLIQMLTAEEVILSGETWTLTNGSVTIFAEESSFPLTQSFKTKKIVVNEDSKDLQNSDPNSDVLTLAELKRFILKNKEAGLDTLRYEVDYHAKFGFAFSGFVLAFLGIPFSVTRQRSGGAIKNIGACMFWAFVYWAFYNSGIALGRHGNIYPVVAAWLPNVAILALSFFFLFKLKK